MDLYYSYDYYLIKFLYSHSLIRHDCLKPVPFLGPLLRNAFINETFMPSQLLLCNKRQSPG